MKGKTIGYFKNVQNVGYCAAATDLKVGMGVILERDTKIARLPKDAAEAKTCHYWVSNINDKPDMYNFADTLLVAKGEKVRADDFFTVANMEMEIASYEVSTAYDSVAKGDNLVYGTDGLLAKATDVTGYKVYFEVIGKTAYTGNGYLALVHVQ